MPRKEKRSFPLGLNDGILPNFNLSDRLCYFLDLQTAIATNKPLTKHKQALFDKAEESIVQPMNSMLTIGRFNQGEEIKSAIEFLSDIAQNERNKEIAVVEQYIDKLQKELPPNFLTKNKDMKQLLQRLKNFSANPTGGTDLKDFYADLTICINTIRNKIEMFQERLNQLLDKNRKTFEDLAADQYAFRVGSDIEGLLKNAIGLKERQIEDSFASTIQEFIIDFVAEEFDAGNIAVTEHIPAVLTGLMIDFSHFLQSKKIPGVNLDDLPKDILKQYWEDFKSGDSAFMQGLRENTEMFNQTLTTIEEEMGYRQIKDKTEEWKKRQNQIDYRNRTRKNGSNNPNVGRQKFRAMSQKAYREQLRDLEWTHFDVKANRHGTIYEIIQSVINKSLKVRGHAATDVITLGSIRVDLNPKLADQMYLSLLPMKEELENFEKKQRADRKDDLKKDFEAMNQSIYGVLKSLDNELKSMDIPENLFIYHDSLKLYVRIDEGKTNEFHGRDLQALNALDRLYAMDGYDNLALPDQELLYNLLINIPNGAVGQNLEEEVENYLSIFAGLLMFDDMQNMAREIAQQTEDRIEYSNLKNIHMYLLNDVYVPSSMILTYVSQALNDGYNYLNNATNAAKVNIESGSAADLINAYNQSNVYGSHFYSIDDWEPMGNLISKNINIKIIFLKGFLQFIQDIQNRLK